MLILLIASWLMQTYIFFLSRVMIKWGVMKSWRRLLPLIRWLFHHRTTKIVFLNTSPVLRTVSYRLYHIFTPSCMCYHSNWPSQVLSSTTSILRLFDTFLRAHQFWNYVLLLHKVHKLWKVQFFLLQHLLFIYLVLNLILLVSCNLHSLVEFLRLVSRFLLEISLL